jgi:predicted ATP-dependent endonuclease of OLD family
MLKNLKLENFTVFEQAEFEFSSGLNLLIGENGAGKTHVLKAAYLMYFSLYNNEETTLYTSYRFANIFKPDSVYQLCQKASDQADLALSLHIGNKAYKNTVSIIKHGTEPKNFSSELQVIIDSRDITYSSLFFPAKELLSIYPNFVALYEKYHLAFDETYYDTCKALQNPLLRKIESPEKEIIQDLETIIGGKIVLQGDHFYLQHNDALMNINMVAEGHRKIAMLAYLIANDSLKKGSALFWDEPESGLNPRLLKDLARAIMALCKNGIQVFIATHSLFLLRELEILHAQAEYQTVPTRFFNLVKQGNNVVVAPGDDPYSIGDIAALDESMAQSNRFLALD